jgi:hypothetical protein
LQLAAQKQQKAQENKKLRKARTKLRSLCKGPGFAPPTDDVELLCNKLPLSNLAALVKLLEKEDGIRKKNFSDMFIFVEEGKALFTAEVINLKGDEVAKPKEVEKQGNTLCSNNPTC